MTRSSDDLEALVRSVLSEVAPDADVDGLGADDDIRDTLDLDSVDFLNVMVAIHERTGIDVPERDYGKLSTLDAAVAYLSGSR